MRITEALLFGMLCTSSAQAQSSDWVRRAVLDSRVMGAHGEGYNGEGYNMDSLNQLSRRLIAADIPAIVELLPDKELHMGAIFALASQCEAGIVPARDAEIAKNSPFSKPKTSSIRCSILRPAPTAPAKKLLLWRRN